MKQLAPSLKSAAGGQHVIRVSARTQSRASCYATVAVKKARQRLTKARATKSGRVSWRWQILAESPSGTWRITVTCSKGKRKGSASRRVLVLTGSKSASGPIGNPHSLTVLHGEPAGRGGAECGPFTDRDLPPGGKQCTCLAWEKRRDVYDTARARGITGWNGGQWLVNAQRAGFPTGSQPVKGALVVWGVPNRGSSDYGHVAYVEDVESPTRIRISECNYDWKGSCRTIWMNPQARANLQGYVYGGPAGNSGAGQPVDSDGDGIPDSHDHCPAAAGPVGNSGCPLQVTPSQFQSFAGDFNGDKHVDVGLRDVKSGMFYFRYGPSFTHQTTFKWDNSTAFQSFAGDFNGDKQVDAGLRDPHSGMFYIRYGPSFTQQTAFKWDNSTAYQSFAGDFNGDKQVDLGLRNIQSGMFYARYGPSFMQQSTLKWDNSTDYQAFLGDFNGDNKVDAGLRNVHNGMFDVRYGPSLAAQTAFKWDHTTTYQSFAGDFNGDKQVDFGLRNIHSGMFYIRFGPGFTHQITYPWAPG